MAEPRTVRENANALNSEQIAALLPHRYPFALVDRILDYEPGQWAIGRKCVSRNEEFFCGHFPGQPVMPGVLILEALAQTGAVAALSVPENKGKLALFGGIKNARFRKQVTPGDVLTLHCELVEQRGPGGHRESIRLCGWQVRRHSGADLCADRSKYRGLRRFVRSDCPQYHIIYKRQDTIAMMISCLCSFLFTVLHTLGIENIL